MGERLKLDERYQDVLRIRKVVELSSKVYSYSRTHGSDELSLRLCNISSKSVSSQGVLETQAALAEIDSHALQLLFATAI